MGCLGLNLLGPAWTGMRACRQLLGVLHSDTAFLLLLLVVKHAFSAWVSGHLRPAGVLCAAHAGAGAQLAFVQQHRQSCFVTYELTNVPLHRRQLPLRGPDLYNRQPGHC